jgi:dTDP-4-amino-4,6-dideoxy-D-galactose acyltransferase
VSARRSVRLNADAPCTLLPWDTDFWGVRIARVEGSRLTPPLLERVDEWSQENEVSCLYFLADATDAPTALTAEDGDFRLMDVRVELRRRAGPEQVNRVREAREDDTEPLRAIARASHGITRFYADPRFSNARCDDFYDTWITRSLGGWARQVLVAERDDRAVGYVSCHLDDAESLGSIGLIAVDERARGGGIGVSLARAAVDWCAAAGAETVSVVTQGRNVNALRTFERAGFVVHELGLWFHKWYPR